MADGHGSSTDDTVAVLAGPGTSIPGMDKDGYADALLALLVCAAHGQEVFPQAGQQRGWLRKEFLKSATGAGQKSWKFFKTKYKEQIELDHDEYWVRLLPEQAPEDEFDEHGTRTS